MKNCSVTVIGGANVDIYGIPFGPLVHKDSNPGEIKTYHGGVGRNIAENLARLGVETHLLTLVGDDVYGHKILRHSKQLGIHVNHSVVVAGGSTNVYFAVLNSSKDMEVAIIDAKILERMDCRFIEARTDIIGASRVCFLETNIPKETLDFILEHNPDVIFFLDPVSSFKAAKVIDTIGNFHSIKPNRTEAEVLAGMAINNNDDVIKASEMLLGKGVKRVFISLDKDGVFYNDGSSKGFLKVIDVRPVNASGAGGAFSSAMAYGYLQDMNIEDTARFALAASVITLEDELAVSTHISVDAVYEKINGLYYV